MNMEFNKIFAAVLVAGIVASFSGFVAEHIMHVEELTENSYKIEIAKESGGDRDTEKSASSDVEKPAGPEPVLALLSEADISRGEKLSRACAACHSFTKGGANGAGPNLWNVVQRAKASKSGFSYSGAMKEKGGSWTYDELNHFLWKPKAFIEGTKMSYIGMKKAEDRAALIAWLRTLSDNPVSLPSVSEIEAESSEQEESAE